MQEVTTPNAGALKWAIIMSRILILPLVLEALIFSYALVLLALEGPKVFDSWGILIAIFCGIAGFHGVFAGICVIFGWRMARRRGLGEVPRVTALWGAVAGFIYFLLPAIPLCFEPDADLLTFFLMCSIGTWPALVFAVLCVRLRRHAPPRDGAPGMVVG